MKKPDAEASGYQGEDQGSDTFAVDSSPHHGSAGSHAEVALGAAAKARLQHPAATGRDRGHADGDGRLAAEASDARAD